MPVAYANDSYGSGHYADAATTPQGEADPRQAIKVERVREAEAVAKAIRPSTY